MLHKLNLSVLLFLSPPLIPLIRSQCDLPEKNFHWNLNFAICKFAKFNSAYY